MKQFPNYTQSFETNDFLRGSGLNISSFMNFFAGYGDGAVNDGQGNGTGYIRKPPNILYPVFLIQYWDL